MLELHKKHPFWAHYFWTYAAPLAVVLLILYYPEPLYALRGEPFHFLTLLQTTIVNSGVELRGGTLGPLLSALWPEGILVFAALMSATPMVIALILAPLTFGKQGFITLIGRLRPWLDGVDWKKGLGIWGLAILALCATNFATYLLRSALGSDSGITIAWNDRLLSGAFFWLLLEAMFLNQGGLLEELGFRGYALPILQQRMSPLNATLLLGICWALWHIPRDILFETPGTLGMTWYLLGYLPLFTIWCVGGSILMTYFFNRTGGSALIAIAIHGMLNDSAMIGGIAQGGGLLEHMVPKAMTVGGAGLLVLLLAGRNLGLSSATRHAATPF